jgi:hypothetical protein
MTTGQVAGQLVIDLKAPAFDELARFALAAKAVGLELD